MLGGIISLVIIVVGIAFLLLIIKVNYRNNINSVSEYGFIGNGTEDSPYLISSVEDFQHFRDLVNEGESFVYKYFKQTEDIDLISVENWLPIGVYGTDKYFYGYYDGDGHTLSNFKCTRPEDFGVGVDFNAGLFGVLCGEVRNLGIESGSIDGFCVGSIASHGIADAAIINCYNKAAVNGYRAGGIADNFRGTILFCFNLGQVSGTESAGIVSYDAKEIYGCYSSTTDNLVTESYTGRIKRSMVISKWDMDAAFIKNYYKTINEWNEGYVNKENLSKIVIKNGDIWYADKNIFNILGQVSILELMLAAMITIMVILIRVDYIVNIRKQKKENKEDT